MSKTMNKFSPEVRERAVRMVLDNGGQDESRWQAVVSLSAKVGCSANALHARVKKAEVDNGARAGIPSDTVEKLKALERENRELRQANEILRKARQLVLRWRSSAAGRSDGVVHRQSSWGAWGRADL